MNIRYTTITEGFDWGPAVSRLVLDFGIPLDAAAVSPEKFAVTVHFENPDASTSRMDGDHRRPVTAAWLSDEYGCKTPGGCIILEMPVAPELKESALFYYDDKTARNKYLDMYYKISLVESACLYTADGQRLPEIGKTECAGNINLIADDFDNDQQFSHNGIELSFASFSPPGAAGAALPLIIWLHGAGEGGRDSRIALLGNKVVNLAAGEIQRHFGEGGAYVLVPQAPTMWMDYNGRGIYNTKVPRSKGGGGGSGKSFYTEALMALIDSYVTRHPINKNRIYIGGCSNGGYMTVQLIISYPEYFAAAWPVCAAYNRAWLTRANIEAIRATPIWLTHALNDNVVSHDFSTWLYERLMAEGAGNVHYSQFDAVRDLSGRYFKADGISPYEYYSHFSWIHVLNNDCYSTVDGSEISLFEWMAAQSR